MIKWSILSQDEPIWTIQQHVKKLEEGSQLGTMQIFVKAHVTWSCGGVGGGRRSKPLMNLKMFRLDPRLFEDHRQNLAIRTNGQHGCHKTGRQGWKWQNFGVVVIIAVHMPITLKLIVKARACLKPHDTAKQPRVSRSCLNPFLYKSWNSSGDVYDIFLEKKPNRNFWSSLSLIDSCYWKI